MVLGGLQGGLAMSSVTKDEASLRLKQRMQELQVVGFSSLGEFSPENHLEHLDEIERIVVARKNQAVSGLSSNPDSLDAE